MSFYYHVSKLKIENNVVWGEWHIHNIFKMEDKDGADEEIIASVQIHPGMYAILKLKSFWYNT